MIEDIKVRHLSREHLLSVKGFHATCYTEVKREVPQPANSFPLREGFQHTFNCFSTASVFISKNRLNDSMPIKGVSERGKLSMG